jgi:FMN-dependent oxidoreductase (nitrilotriacetate monooxygenase family)
MFHLGWFLSYAPQEFGGRWSGTGRMDWVDPGLYADAARMLERAGFDYLMLEDGSFIADAHGSSMEHSLRRGFTAPKHDPVQLVGLIGAATSRIGVISTITTTFYPPFLAARLLTTLDHLTHGRVGANLVTAHNDRTAQNFGLDKHLDHDLRYEMAGEWVETVQALWRTWDPDAVVDDAEAGVFVDHEKLHHANVEGRFYRTRGPLNTLPGPQRNPVLCQAGASPAGRAFGSRYADTIVAQAGDIEQMQAYRADVRSQALAAGRDPDDVKVLFLCNIVLADTDAEAREKRTAREVVTDASIDAALAAMSFASGVDFSKFDLDGPVPEVETNAARGSLAAYLHHGDGRTLREIASRPVGGSVAFTGTVESVAEQMGEVATVVGGDGFLVQAPATRRNLAEIADGLAPALRRRGLIRDGYEFATLRENLLAF